MSGEFVPIGSIALDLALGGGGVPKGHITEIFGPESSGKTTICQHIIARVQQTGGHAAFLDVERTLDHIYATRCEIDTANLLISHPDTCEQALEIVDSLIQSHTIDVVVIDSATALVPKNEIAGNSHAGLKARLMSPALRKLTYAISGTNCILIFTNKVRREKSDTLETSEGKALKFYSSIRLATRRTNAIKQGLDSVGSRIYVRVVKNRVTPLVICANVRTLFV